MLVSDLDWTMVSRAAAQGRRPSLGGRHAALPLPSENRGSGSAGAAGSRLLTQSPPTLSPCRPGGPQRRHPRQAAPFQPPLAHRVCARLAARLLIRALARALPRAGGELPRPPVWCTGAPRALHPVCHAPFQAWRVAGRCVVPGGLCSACGRAGPCLGRPHARAWQRAWRRSICPLGLQAALLRNSSCCRCLCPACRSQRCRC